MDLTYTQDTPEWCDPCARPRQDCGHFHPGAPETAAGLYADIAAFLDGEQQTLTPTLMRRDDGAHLFYRGKLNVLVGDPESAKTWVALAAVTLELRAGRKALYIDADHNGPDGIVPRLIIMGAPAEALRDRDRFRYIELDDPDTYSKVIASADTWKPAVTVIDSHQAIAEMHGLSDNDGGDMRKFHRTLTLPFARNGGAAILIDHMAKNETSRAFGATGSTAKSAAINGAYYRVSTMDAWSPSTGGASKLEVVKDRPGGVRRNCAPAKGRDKPFAGTFRLHAPQPGNPVQAWAVYAPGRDGVTPVLADLIGRIDNLTEPQRASAQKVADALRVRKADAVEALREWRNQRPEEREPLDAIPEPALDLAG